MCVEGQRNFGMKFLMVKVIKVKGDSFTHLFFEPTAATQCCFAFVVPARPSPPKNAGGTTQFQRQWDTTSDEGCKTEGYISHCSRYLFFFFFTKYLNVGSLDKVFCFEGVVCQEVHGHKGH